MDDFMVLRTVGKKKKFHAEHYGLSKEATIEIAKAKGTIKAPMFITRKFGEFFDSCGHPVTGREKWELTR